MADQSRYVVSDAPIEDVLYDFYSHGPTERKFLTFVSSLDAEKMAESFGGRYRVVHITVFAEEHE